MSQLEELPHGCMHTSELSEDSFFVILLKGCSESFVTCVVVPDSRHDVGVGWQGVMAAEQRDSMTTAQTPLRQDLSILASDVEAAGCRTAF